jgi:translocation and assembly module TamA
MRAILQLAGLRPVQQAMRMFIFGLAVVIADSASAQLQYQLEIDAPGEMAQTLRQGLYIARWQQDPQMTPEQLRRLAQEALDETREVAATEGYFSPQVEVRIDESREPWIVRLSVEPGERTEVDEVDIRFSGPAVEDGQARYLIRRVRDTWGLARGQPFRQADWDAAKRRAVLEMSAWRYAGARIAESRALIDPVRRRATLSVEIASGPPYRFGDLRVSGTRRYAEELVENLSPFRAGDDYDRDKLLLYQRRLLESGYFVSVQADLVPEGGAPQGAPVRVAVIEASKHHVEVGLGYNTDVGPRFELRYSNQDLRDSAWRLRSGLGLDRRIQSLQLDLDSPPRAEGRWTSFFGRARQTDIQNQFTRELAGGVALNWGIEATPSALIASAHLEEQRVAGDVTDNRHALYLGHRRTYRRTDDFIAPRSGYMALLEVGGAPPGVSTRPFLRGILNGSWFIPVGRRGDLLLRGQAGAVLAESRQGIPTSFLFRTGGDQTVRGYAFESLGVRQGDAIVGGRRLVVMSTEYTHWIAENWGIAGFVDAGNAWDSVRPSRLAVGSGIGARLRTPIGPIRADLAYGRDERTVRLHFSVGYTF